MPQRPRHLSQPAAGGRHAAGARGRVFLARRSIEPGAGLWTYPGGFLEVGESAQEGARRETEEETQLRVEVGRLIGAYSRPHVSVVTLIYEATVVGGEALPGVETIEVRDFGPDEIPWEELAFTTGESALRDWVASLPGRGPRFEPELYVTGDPRTNRLAPSRGSGGRPTPRSGRRSRSR